MVLSLVFHLWSFQSPGCLAAVGQDHRPYRAAENPPRGGLNARGCLGMTTEIPERLWVPTTALHPPWQQLKKAGPGAGRSRTDGETFGPGPRPADDGGRSARATKLSPLSSALLAAPTGPVDCSSLHRPPPSPAVVRDGGGGLRWEMWTALGCAFRHRPYSAGADGGGQNCWLGTTFLQCLPSPLPGRQRDGGGGDCGRRRTAYMAVSYTHLTLPTNREV